MKTFLRYASCGIISGTLAVNNITWRNLSFWIILVALIVYGLVWAKELKANKGD